MISDQAGNSAPARVPADGALAGERSGPTALRIALGAQLRRLREASNLTTGEAAEAIRATHSKISRLERGRSAARQRDVADLLTLYGVTDEAEREELLALTRQAGAPGWWQQYSDILPKWFELYIGLEKAASIIIANAHAPAEDIDRRVSVRMRRQQLLTQPGAPELWAVLDEAALRRAPDRRKVMRAQLEQLLQITDLPNVTLQIVPFHVGPHAAAGGPFTILRFPEPDLPDLVYLEQLNSAVYLDQPDDVIDYVTVMDRLCVQAETGAASKDLLSALLKRA